MQAVSQAFLDAMIAVERQTYGRVELVQVDTTAAGDATVTATSTESITSPSNTVDGYYTSPPNYATFETDRFKLDGSFSLLPSSAPYGSIGWWSSLLSDVNKSYSVSQVLTFQFTVNHSSIGFTIIFDETNNEYATDFELVIYDSGNNVLNTFTVTNNTLSVYVVDTTVNNYRKAILTITKWSKAYRRARVTELLFGQIKIFDGSLLTKMNVVEEVDPTSINSPQNQLTFNFDNSTNIYDILNPTGIYAYLQKQQQIKAYFGGLVGEGIQYVSMGVYYLSEWTTQSNQLEASFKANDAFDLLQNKYRKGLYQSRSLYNLAVDVLTDAGFTSDKYSVDTALQSITVQSYIPLITCRQALQLIALAGQAVMYCDRAGKVIIKQLTSVSTGLEIDFANAYKAPKVELDNVLMQVDVNVYSFVADAGTSTVFKGSVTLSGQQSIWVEYQNPATGGSASLDVGVLNSATYYTTGALLTITYTGTVTITLTGYKLNEYSYPVTTSNESSGDTLKVDNKLIVTSSQASSVGFWVKTEKIKRKILKSEWRQNPAVEATDIVDIETQFGTYSNTRVTKQTFEYAGTLKGVTEVRG